MDVLYLCSILPRTNSEHNVHIIHDLLFTPQSTQSQFKYHSCPARPAHVLNPQDMAGKPNPTLALQGD